MERLLAQGVGDNQTVGLVPVMLRYLRLHVLRRDVAPGPKRELLTLAYTIDRLLQRDVLGALDIIMQRVKSLELVVGGFQLGSGAKFGVGAPRAREDCKHSRSPRRGERIQARRQSSERTWERQREVDRGLERRPQREEGGRQGWARGQEGTVLEGTRGSSSGANQAELTPCLGAAAHKLQPLVHAARGFPDGIRQDATRLTGSAFEDYPFSSVLLGGELLKLLLGRGCGFGDAVSNFCETSPIETAEGRVKKECNISPAPTQQPRLGADERKRRSEGNMALYCGVQLELPQWWHSCTNVQRSAFKGTIEDIGLP